MICPQCGYENAIGATTCTRCAYVLGSGTGQMEPARYEGTAPPPAPGPGGPGPQPPPPAYGYSTPPPPTPAYGSSQTPAEPPPAYGYNTAAPTPSPYSPPPQPPMQEIPESARLAAGAPTAPPPRQSHMVRNILMVAAVLVVLVGGFSAYAVYQALNKPNITATKLIPADVYGYITIAAKPTGDQKVALDTLQDAFKSQPGFQAAWDKIFNEVSEAGPAARTALGDCGDTTATPDAAATPGTGDDLSQFLGDNVTLAMLALSKDEASQISGSMQGGGESGQNGGGESDMVKTLQSKILIFVDLDFNPLNKKGLVRRLAEQKDKGKAGVDMPLVETYREVEIRKLVIEPCGGATDNTDASAVPEIYMALIGGTAAVTLDPAPLHGVIDRYKDGKGSLQDTPAFQGLDADLPKDRLLTIYLNMSAVYDTVQSIVPLSGDDTTTQVKMTRTDGAIAIAVAAHKDGLQIDGSSDLQVDGQAMGSTAIPAAATLNDIPAGSWLFYTGTDLKATIEQTLALYRKQGMGETIDSTMADVKENLGIDVEQDLLPLLGGDYAISMQGQKGAEELNLSAVVELNGKPGDGAGLTRVVDTLNQHMADQGGEAMAVPVGNASLWSSPMAPVLYGVVGDKFFLVGSSDMANETASRDVAQAVLDGQGKGIGTDATVQARLKHLPDKSTATLYVDLGKIRTEGVEPMLTDASNTSALDDEGPIPVFPAPSRDDYNQNIAPFLKPLQYLLSGGATSIRNNMTHTHSVFFVGIGK